MDAKEIFHEDSQKNTKIRKEFFRMCLCDSFNKPLYFLLVAGQKLLLRLKEPYNIRLLI